MQVNACLEAFTTLPHTRRERLSHTKITKNNKHVSQSTSDVKIHNEGIQNSSLKGMKFKQWTYI